MRIGFIGAGIMGKPMIRNLMTHGYELHIYARTYSHVEDVVGDGAIFHETIKDCVDHSDAVITMVGFPEDVEDVYLSKNGILNSAREEMYLIDMTTTSPVLDTKIYAEAKKRGIHVLDAPVTGGEAGAISGKLSIFVGGDKVDYDACYDIFAAMGTNINYQGKIGNGQHAKMANQIMIAGTMAGICEAIRYAEAQGLDIHVLLQSIGTGSAGSKQLDLNGEKILDRDYSPRFFMKHFIKDMKIAKEESEEKKLSLDVLGKILSHYQELEKQGDGNLGTQTLIKYYYNKAFSSMTYGELYL